MKRHALIFFAAVVALATMAAGASSVAAKPHRHEISNGHRRYVSAMADDILRAYAKQITEIDGVEYPHRNWKTGNGWMFLSTEPKAIGLGICESEVLMLSHGGPDPHPYPRTIVSARSAWHMAVEDKYRIVGPTGAVGSKAEEDKTIKSCRKLHDAKDFFSFYGSWGSEAAGARSVAEAIEYIRKYKLSKSDPRYSKISTDRLWYVVMNPCSDVSDNGRADHTENGIKVRYEYICYTIDMGRPLALQTEEKLKFRTIEKFDRRTESRIKYDVDQIEYTNESQFVTR